MKNYLNAIRIIAFICIVGKAVSVSFGATDGETNLSTLFYTILITFLLLTLLYFAIEFSTRFFIWPQVKEYSRYRIFQEECERCRSKRRRAGTRTNQRGIPTRHP
jgi:hypothetical protein